MPASLGPRLRTASGAKRRRGGVLSPWTTNQFDRRSFPRYIRRNLTPTIPGVQENATQEWERRRLFEFSHSESLWITLIAMESEHRKSTKRQLALALARGRSPGKWARENEFSKNTAYRWTEARSSEGGRVVSACAIGLRWGGVFRAVPHASGAGERMQTKRRGPASNWSRDEPSAPTCRRPCPFPCQLPSHFQSETAQPCALFALACWPVRSVG